MEPSNFCFGCSRRWRQLRIRAKGHALRSSYRGLARKLQRRAMSRSASARGQINSLSPILLCKKRSSRRSSQRPAPACRSRSRTRPTRRSLARRRESRFCEEPAAGWLEHAGPVVAIRPGAGEACSSSAWIRDNRAGGRPSVSSLPFKQWQRGRTTGGLRLPPR